MGADDTCLIRLLGGFQELLLRYSENYLAPNVCSAALEKPGVRVKLGFQSSVETCIWLCSWLYGLGSKLKKLLLIGSLFDWILVPLSSGK